MSGLGVTTDSWGAVSEALLEQIRRFRFPLQPVSMGTITELAGFTDELRSWHKMKRPQITLRPPQDCKPTAGTPLLT